MEASEIGRVKMLDPKDEKIAQLRRENRKLREDHAAEIVRLLARIEYLKDRQENYPGENRGRFEREMMYRPGQERLGR